MIALTKGLVEPHYHIRLNNGFREDLRMWKQLIENWNGNDMFMYEVYEDSNTLPLYTDALGARVWWVSAGRYSFKGDGRTR